MKLFKALSAHFTYMVCNERGALQISDISAILKKIIIPRIQVQIPAEVPLMSQIKKNVGTTVANNQIFIAARTARHSGIYAVAEGVEPQTGKSAYAQPSTPVAFCFGTLQLTDQALEAAMNGDAKAVAPILGTEISALKDDFKLDLNRMYHGKGTGILCTANGLGSSTTALVVQANPNGGDATDYLQAGGWIKIGSGANVQILTINSATSVTLVTASSWSNGDVVTRADAAEPMGLVGLIDDGSNLATVQSIVRSSNQWAKSWVDDTSATLTEAQMIAMWLKARRYGGRKTWMLGEVMYRKYGALLLSLKRNTEPKPVLSGGWMGLDFMGGQSEVLLDFDTWSGFCQLVDFQSLTIAEMSKPFDWLAADAQGGILRRSATNRTIWEGTLKYYHNLIALKFRTMARLSNKTET